MYTSPSSIKIGCPSELNTRIWKQWLNQSSGSVWHHHTQNRKGQWENASEKKEKKLNNNKSTKRYVTQKNRGGGEICKKPTKLCVFYIFWNLFYFFQPEDKYIFFVIVPKLNKQTIESAKKYCMAHGTKKKYWRETK